MTTTLQPAVTLPHLEDYTAIVGQPEIAELRTFAKPLAGRTLTMVNSTAVGGGVAEILNRLMPLLNETGLQARWEVMTGDGRFFAVTKAMHNALHGAPFLAPPDAFDVFLAANEQNRKRIVLDSEFTVIHDPQPAALIAAREKDHGYWIWRCHIDLSHADKTVWDFLRPWVERYDKALFSAPAFTQRLLIPQILFYPTIDPLADKNRELDPRFVESVLARFQIDPARPILTQISRFDRLKDPVGVIQAFRMVRRYHDCQLVLAGGGASDDPEGAEVLAEVMHAANEDPDIHVLELPPTSHLEINALQRGSTIIIQKSLREGFGLTVSEALWKKKPVVASAVGGIPSQVLHKITGVLTQSVEGTAYQLRFLLSNPEFARRLGENGHEHVKENFLITHNVKRYLLLFLRALNKA
ncbi:MAG: glycosyltransferase [Acidobacteriales bacterium]|nr:glycosyltransferase [Terriglobales bacterium]